MKISHHLPNIKIDQITSSEKIMALVNALCGGNINVYMTKIFTQCVFKQFNKESASNRHKFREYDVQPNVIFCAAFQLEKKKKKKKQGVTALLKPL
jgi:hypothetical protein